MTEERHNNHEVKTGSSAESESATQEYRDYIEMAARAKGYDSASLIRMIPDIDRLLRQRKQMVEVSEKITSTPHKAYTTVDQVRQINEHIRHMLGI